MKKRGYLRQFYLATENSGCLATQSNQRYCCAGWTDKIYELEYRMTLRQNPEYLTWNKSLSIQQLFYSKATALNFKIKEQVWM